MIEHPDLAQLHDAVALAATIAFNHVPGDKLLGIVGPIRRELTALRNGTDPTRLYQLIDELKAQLAAPEGVAAVADLRRAAVALGVMITP